MIVRDQPITLNDYYVVNKQNMPKKKLYKYYAFWHLAIVLIHLSRCTSNIVVNVLTSNSSKKFYPNKQLKK